MHNSILIILYLANFVFFLRFLSAFIQMTAFHGVELIYSSIFLILTFGTIYYFNFKLFTISLITSLVVFGIIRINANRLGMRMDNSNSKKSIFISIVGLVIVLFSSVTIYNYS